MLHSRSNPSLFKIENSLGPLEFEVMKVIWIKEMVSVRDIVNILNKNKAIAYTTVMTVMDHLHKKGFLKREMSKKSFIYSPILQKKNMINNSLFGIFSNLSSDYGKTKILYSVVGATVPDIPQAKPAGLSAALTILLALFCFSAFDLVQNISFSGTLDYINLLSTEPTMLIAKLHLFIPAFFESLPIINLLTVIISTILILILGRKIIKIFSLTASNIRKAY